MRWLGALGAAALVFVFAASGKAVPERAHNPPAPAADLYALLCAPCHGKKGDGRGPAAPWLWPRPRDFSAGEFKWKTTATGAPPTSRDITRTIAFGVPGTSMPAFGDVLSKAQIADLGRMVRAFSPPQKKPAVALDIPPPPAEPSALVARGEAIYGKLGCALCHGKRGRGDGSAAATLVGPTGLPAPPYDLSAHPLRRPRGPGESTLKAIFMSLKTGLAATPMPAYDSATTDAELWAVSAYVATFLPGRAALENRADEVDPMAQKLATGENRVRTGYYPGRGDPAAMKVFGHEIGLQGEPPAALAPAQASLSPRQCARCHAKQWREWRGSIHAQAVSPGLLAQILPMAHAGRHATVESCQRCHAPLAEQRAAIRTKGQKTGYTKNSAFDPVLRGAGITCAGCHVRNWRRLGPPRIADTRLPSLPSYPLTELAIYERADFCLPCHQLPPRPAPAGKPLLNTYREWLAGPYMRRGIQCQSCHMPGREHTWKGIHDPDAVRQGIALSARAEAAGDDVRVSASLENIGAGHYLPTTPTPALWLEIQLIDGAGKAIPGAAKKLRIGRRLVYRRRFVELEDTRIPPGRHATLSAAWQGPGAANARAAVITVRVFPDEYYERFYAARLEGKLSAKARGLFVRALARARAARYIALTRTVAIRR